MATNSVVAYPLAAPTVSGSLITVDTMLQQPTRVTRRIADLTLQRFIVDRIFANSGGVSGGAVIYDQATTNELYTDRDVQQVAPGAEFPLVTSSRQTPKVAQVEKYGGKFFITDEARDRNDVGLFNNRVTQLANTIVKKINTRAVAELDAAISAIGSDATVSGHNWGTVVTGGSSQTNATGWPAADIAAVQYVADVDELGVTFDLWIVNPKQKMQFFTVYGADRAQSVLDNLGVEMYASNRVADGTAYVVARGQVGELRMEQPLATESIPDRGTQRTWIQSSVRPVMYVTNPYAVKKVTGLDG